MNRVISAVIIATAAATIAAAAAITPAMAALHPAHSHPASHAKLTAHANTAKNAKEAKEAKQAARGAKLSVSLPDQIASEFSGGKYVTIVRCSGTVTPPAPVHIARPDAPLTVHGRALEAKVIKLLGKPHTYRTIYSCQVIVKVKVPLVVKVPVVVKKVKKTTHKKTCEIGPSGKGAGGKGASCSRVVTLNTGFGGAAGQVAGHHPAK